jgi:co-chaperonin GroES (HSP10)
MDDLIIIGARVLIAPEDGERQTKSGLYLPATVRQKEHVHSGWIVRTGPGFRMANPEFSDEPWTEREAVRYLPMQARAGDFAFFVRDQATEIVYQDQTYLIVPHDALLALVRQDAADVLDRLGIQGDEAEG